jgi:1-acyl-sn-glycerol-3-phosphate acyltransferase
VSDADAPVPAELNRIERLAMRLAQFTNERELPKKLQTLYLRAVTEQWIGPATMRRTLVHNLEPLLTLNPDRGVIFASNHRSFFDLYLVMLALFTSGKSRWARRIYFPVRANFFYERPLGMFVNYFVGGGSMYPPIFREASRAELNKEAVERVLGFLKEPGTLVGMHPEGTRGKGPDPYELLPAQPGLGQLVLQARPIVIPIFINGLSNDIVGDIRLNFRKGARRERPVIIAYGDPVDYSDFTTRPPRAALYKKCSDFIHEKIRALSQVERALRADCVSGAIGDDDPRWLGNFRKLHNP